MKWFIYYSIGQFVFFAALQYNDPDPEVWMPVYLIVALEAWLLFKEKLAMPVSITSLLSYIGLAIYWARLVPSWNSDNEELREFGGLIVSAIWFGIYSVILYRKGKS